MPTLRLVLASNNAKKLAELQALFSGLQLELVTQGSLGVTEADEPFHTFIENGLAKARHAAAATGCAALADDSGLCVDALGGAPGVLSAHFAGRVVATGDRETSRETTRSAQDAVNNALLLSRLQGVADRRAQFVSTLVAVRHAGDPQPLVAVGRWQGEIAQAPRGAGGFGYDPLMFIAEQGCMAAELPADVKNQLSHRGRAAALMRAMLREVWRL
jgi:XTP/dITP diphosphohydrolase